MSSFRWIKVVYYACSCFHPCQQILPFVKNGNKDLKYHLLRHRTHWTFSKLNLTLHLRICAFEFLKYPLIAFFGHENSLILRVFLKLLVLLVDSSIAPVFILGASLRGYRLRNIYRMGLWSLCWIVSPTSNKCLAHCKIWKHLNRSIMYF